MLPKEFRLKQDKDFARAFRKGRFFPGQKIVMRVVVNGLAVSRFGFVVGTKVSKKAVKRNLLKRRMRAAVAGHLAKLVPGFDVVFIAGTGASTMEFTDVKSSVERHLLTARLVSL